MERKDLAILRILLVRHGLSEDNQNAIWAGHRDSPLTVTGVQQAKALGAALSSFSFVAIYSSDLKRASSTAEQILAANRSIPPPPLVQTQSLREQYFGQAEGKSWSDGEYAHTAAAQSHDARSFRFAEGESLDDVNARMGVSLRRYVLPRLEALRTGQDRSEPQIIIVAHGIAIAEILRVLMSMHDANSNAHWPDPMATYKRVRLENTGWTLVELAVPIGEGDASNSPSSSMAPTAAMPTPVNPAPSPSEDGMRKPTYMRIVQQNITDHLRGPLAIQSPQMSAKGTGSVGGSSVGNLLAGGSANSFSTTSEAGESPSLATLSLRTVNTYDARQLMRELERIGGTPGYAKANGKEGDAGGSAGQAPNASTSFPNVNVASSPSAAIASAPGAWTEGWQGICVQILPLFNNEDLRTKIETINSNVGEHIRRSLERSPARALDSLSRDLYAVCSAGMFTLNSKLDVVAHDEVRLLEGFVDEWKSFHWRTLPWLEACFLPLETDPTLISLSRQGSDKTTSNLRTELIDIWRIALTVFRDQLIIPRFERLIDLYLRIQEIEAKHLAMLANGTSRVRSCDDLDDPEGDSLESRQLYPRLSQMNSILHGVQTNDGNQAAMDGLERALRVGRERKAEDANGVVDLSITSSSAREAKRAQARQGWLPRSATKHGVNALTGAEGSSDPLSAQAGEESAFLSSLRSPTLEDDDENDEAYQFNTGQGSSSPLVAAPALPLSSALGKAGQMQILDMQAQTHSSSTPSLSENPSSGSVDLQPSAASEFVDDDADVQEQTGFYPGTEEHSLREDRVSQVGLGVPVEQLSGSTLR